jgi:hypothetical protein
MLCLNIFMCIRLQWVENFRDLWPAGAKTARDASSSNVWNCLQYFLIELFVLVTPFEVKAVCE